LGRCYCYLLGRAYVDSILPNKTVEKIILQLLILRQKENVRQTFYNYFLRIFAGFCH
jgi:sulfatase maturation enzyme AslB (radical SAM superfamily)